MTQKIYVQVGVTAMRTPSGEHLPSTPIYMEVEHLTKTGLTELEDESLANIAGFFLEKRKERKERKNGLHN